MKITYAITVCNEIEEIKKLISFLVEKKETNDEIVILFDTANGTDDVRQYLTSINNIHINCFFEKFEHNYAVWKNKLKKRCNGDYIFFIDADELLAEFLINNIKNIINRNNAELYYVPRINTVTGYNNTHIKKWNWNINSNNWINYPDYQPRIIKNKKNIFWKNKVHEVITGNVNHIHLPSEEKFSILHNKHIDRQIKQNNYYDNINTNNTSNKLNIIYRVCDSVSVTSHYNQKRDFGTKKDIILKCFDSLTESINYFNNDYNLYVLLDNTSAEVEDHILSSYKTTNIFKTRGKGNGNSFAECVEIGLGCEGLIFFLEDDYFLSKNCLDEMMFFNNKIKSMPNFLHKNICLYPLDEDRYSKPEQSYIFTGKSVHWRTVKQTTCTFMIDDHILNDQIENLLRYENYGTLNITEDNTINLMYKKYPCFSPMPSLVDHLQFFNCLPPFSKFNYV